MPLRRTKLNRAIHDAGYAIHATSSFTDWKDSPKEALPLSLLLQLLPMDHG